MPILTTLGAACARAWGFTSGLVKDQYFNLVSLLLPGNGTNGAQNNTFLDGSSNTFAITRNGNTTQGTFSPFSQTGWGAYFDGSNDYVSVANNSVLDLATADFCIGFWIYPTAGGTFRRILQWQNGNAANSNYGYAIHIESSNQVSLRCFSGTTGYVITNNTSALQISTWNWVCVTRSGTSGAVYVNGTGVSGTTPATINNPASSLLYISGDLGSTDPLLGYLSGLQIVKGSTTALSTTAPTSPYTAVSGTSLLTFQYNRFRDASSNTLTITPNNGVAITPFAPFAPTQSYSAAAVGGSGYFDGTGDYLTAAGNAAFDFGSGDFTVEGWIYVNSFASSFNITGTWAASPNRGWFLYFDSTLGISFTFSTTGSNATDVTSSYTPPANSWNHIAVVRSGSNLYIYVNGVQRGSTYNISTSSIYGNTQTLYIGERGSSLGTPITGYISNFRIVKGTAITPPSGGPTSLLTAVSGTSLLLNFTNAGVVDATAKNVLETVGNAQISTTQSKWGGGSIYLDGTANTAVRLVTGNILSPFSGDYTYECWVRFSSFTGVPVIFDTRASNGSVPGLQLSCTTGGVLQLYGGATTSTLLITGATLSTGQWYYIALVRSGSGSNNTKLYLDGSQTGSSATDTTNYNNQGGFIGAGASGTSNYVTGYIDDFRFTRYARPITASPTSPFPVQ